MVDSTHVLRSAPDTWASRWNAERRRRYAVRRDLTVDIDTRCVNAVMRQVGRDAPPHVDARATAALHVACQTALILGCLWNRKRSMRPVEASAFRMLGALAARAGLAEHEVIGAMTSGIEGAIATARGDLKSGSAPYRTQLGVLDHLKSEAEAFAVEAERELRQGMHSPTPDGKDKSSVLLRLLDGRLSDDELGAASAAAGLDASREHGVVLLVHPTGSTSPLDAAARDIEATVQGAVDLGLSDGLPVSRRLVFPVLTHGRWIEARTNFHDIATKHGVLAIAPIQAPTLRRLAETYRTTERDLARVVEGCGYTSGIIDPACVGPACEAEGTSPAPQTAWALEGAPMPAA